MRENICVEGKGSRDNDGYCKIHVGKKKYKYEHRIAWERRNGKIPDDYVIHHTCGNPSCVNPDHLVALSRTEHSKVHMAQFDGWSEFLVRNLEQRLLDKIRADADAQDRSLSDIMREILCAHYELDCPPSGKTTRVEHGARTQLLRMHPDLKLAIKRDSEETGVSQQRLVHEALEAHYAVA